jgi:L-2-hydroxyglutarate oxidase
MKVLVIGAGLVGLATAHRLKIDYPNLEVTVLDKEQTICSHQSGRNSGVIHSGIYYKPGSLKAEFCRQGRQLIQDFAQRSDVAYQRTGKLIVATRTEEVPMLRALGERGESHGLTIKNLSSEATKEYEPNLECIEAIHVAETGVIDYKEVGRQLAFEFTASGGQTVVGEEMVHARHEGLGWRVVTSKSDLKADFVVNCAGLYADYIGKRFGIVGSDIQIVPFRGEYYELTSQASDLVKGLIYPVPNPEFPFLGVHLTRSIDGGVHAGPNAVLALAREGYKWTDFDVRELARTVAFPGLARLARRHLITGSYEVLRSLSKTLFLKDLRKFIPQIERDDLVASPAGVRAQAIDRSGRLIDDFHITPGRKSLHVLNAPSPAATSSLAIGKYLAQTVRTALDD